MIPNPDNRKALSDLLERFGSSIESFDNLRSDSYEHALAAYSLEHLEVLYTEITRPGQKPEEAFGKCPPWPPGTRRAGESPSPGTLYNIAERLRTESTLNNIGRVSTFLDRVQSRANALPIGNQTGVVDMLINCVGEELIEGKLRGGAISANLDPLDRLLSWEDAKRKKQETAIKEQTFRRETCELFIKWCEDKRALTIANSDESNDAKTKKLIALMFSDVVATEGGNA